jgi:hypothetical protein
MFTSPARPSPALKYLLGIIPILDSIRIRIGVRIRVGIDMGRGTSWRSRSTSKYLILTPTMARSRRRRLAPTIWDPLFRDIKR